MSRLEALESIVAQDPSNSLARYGLAQEYANAGDYVRAVAEYKALLEVSPNYCYAYFHGGQALEKLGNQEEARRMYERGIEAASRVGDEHARSEIQGALDSLK
jgi:tetratricopeptide (TPR) repeat protein